MTGPQENELLTYRSFWEENLQKVEEIAAHLEKNLLALEKKHKTALEHYRKLEKLLDFLLSIYSSYNCFKGREYLLKLKACLSGYSDQTRNESARFDVLHFLLTKVKEHASTGFDDFPHIQHEYRTESPQKTELPKRAELPYRWITFQRGSCWFIAPYETIAIYREDNADIIEDLQDGKEFLIVNNNPLRIVDFPSLQSAPQSRPCFFIVCSYHGRTTCYRAMKIGKKIFASRDVIASGLKEYTHVPGKHIRLFGKRHRYIDI